MRVRVVGEGGHNGHCAGNGGGSGDGSGDGGGVLT